MATILIRLRAPLQSWGGEAYFEDRGTNTEPTKSGVIGLIAAALGRGRSEDISDLAALKMAVRVDREGHVESDFQTINNVLQVNGSLKSTVVAHKEYLADACFLVGLSGDLQLLQEIKKALYAPAWQLFAGRKSFPFSEPLDFDGNLVDKDLFDAITECPLMVPKVNDILPAKIRLIIEDKNGELIRLDQPVNFLTREKVIRKLSVQFIPSPKDFLDEVLL